MSIHKQKQNNQRAEDQTNEKWQFAFPEGEVYKYWFFRGGSRKWYHVIVPYTINEESI